MRKNLTTLIFVSSILFINGCTETEKNGQIHTIIKNNEVCFYIEEPNFKGDYTIYVQIANDEKILTYKNNYENHYPNQQQCIILNNTNFPDWDSLKLNQHYTVSLWSYHKDFYGDHRGGFCAIKENNITKLIPPKNGICPKL